MPNAIGAEGPYSLIPRIVLRPVNGARISLADFWECLQSPPSADRRKRKGVSAKAVAAYYGKRSGDTFYSPLTGKCKSGPRLGRVAPVVEISHIMPTDPKAARMVAAVFGLEQIAVQNVTQDDGVNFFPGETDVTVNPADTP